MIRFLYIALMSVVFFGSFAMAQTPQQLLMLQGRQGQTTTQSESEAYYNEKEGKFVIPENKSPTMIPLDDGRMVPAPMAKTDKEIEATRRGPKTSDLAKMNEAERQKYMDYLVQDRIFLSTSDGQMITTSSGMKLCPVKLNVHNNTPRKLKKIVVYYKWGDTQTHAEFSDVDVLAQASVEIALAGAVCVEVMKGADYDVKVCQMENLTTEQCKMRIAKQ